VYRGRYSIIHTIESEYTCSTGGAQMIRKVIDFFKAINAWGDYTQRKFVISMEQLESWKQFFLVLAVFGIPWLYAWNMHHIVQWTETALGFGPYTPDTYGKIVWRRIWSSAFCAPFITYAIIRFAINRYKQHQQTKKATE
jgi:hypothetical protein